jgi:DHA1 family tetracycline resistance protein-like MFS transporter
MRSPSLLIIFLSVFIDLIGFGIVMPLLPIYTKNFGATGYMIGAIIASFSAMQFLFAPAWGRLSDRIGRRPVILISNAGSTISYALFAIASSMQGRTGLWLLLASRVFAGICGANLSVANAYIADITPPEKRTQKMGLIGMAFGFGFIIGPALGGISYSYFGLQGPGWVASAFCGANFLLGCFVLVESLKPDSGHVPGRPGLGQWVETLRRPVVGPVIFLYFLATFCFACFESTFSLLVRERYKHGPETATYLFTYCGLVAAFVQAGLIGRLNKQFGERKLIVVSIFFVGVSLALLPYMVSWAGILIALGLFAVSSGVNRPPTFGLISLNTSRNEQGTSLGIAQSAASLARIVGPIFANAVYATKFYLPYLLCAGIAVLACFLAFVALLGRTAPAPAAEPSTG